MSSFATYSYVGPPEIAASVQQPEGAAIRSRVDVIAWVAASGEAAPVTATFTVDRDGLLRIAPRRSEHVACAGGVAVRAAGELEIDGGGAVTAASNQSTGYCPEPACWAALADALDRAGVPHPGALTAAFVFRRCPGCSQRCIVKDDWYTCEVCGAALPDRYNV